MRGNSEVHPADGSVLLALQHRGLAQHPGWQRAGDRCRLPVRLSVNRLALPRPDPTTADHGHQTRSGPVRRNLHPAHGQLLALRTQPDSAEPVHGSHLQRAGARHLAYLPAAAPVLARQVQGSAKMVRSGVPRNHADVGTDAVHDLRWEFLHRRLDCVGPGLRRGWIHRREHRGHADRWSSHEQHPDRGTGGYHPAGRSDQWRRCDNLELGRAITDGNRTGGAG